MISCNTHDFVEIACMYQLPLQLIKRNGEVLEGIATDIKLNENKQEGLVIMHQSKTIFVELVSVQSMTCSIKNVHFKTVNFITNEYSQYALP